MATRKFFGLVTVVMLATLRLLWRRRLAVVVLALGLLLQYMYCHENLNDQKPSMDRCLNPPACTITGP
jgi:hypothetical protein